MADDEGTAIPQPEPPSAEAIEEVRGACQNMANVLAAQGLEVSPLVLLAAKVDALVALLGPDASTPVRRHFDFDVARRTASTLRAMIEGAKEASRGPALVVASEVPKDLKIDVVPHAVPRPR